MNFLNKTKKIKNTESRSNNNLKTFKWFYGFEMISIAMQNGFIPICGSNHNTIFKTHDKNLLKKENYEHIVHTQTIIKHSHTRTKVCNATLNYILQFPLFFLFFFPFLFFFKLSLFSTTYFISHSPLFFYFV